MRMWNVFQSRRRLARPVVAVVSVMAVLGAGLVSIAQAVDSPVSAGAAPGVLAPADGGQARPIPVDGPDRVPSPSSDASSSSSSDASSSSSGGSLSSGVSSSDGPTVSGVSSLSAAGRSRVVLPSGPAGLATPSPLSSHAADAPSAQTAVGVRAGVVHTVSFSSVEGGAGVPGAQSVPDGGTASWPREDPSRPGWTFNGWFLDDAAYDFSSPVMGDVTLTARWGRRSVTPDRGPWQGGTDVRISDAADGVRFAQVAAGAGFSVALGSDGNAYTWGDNTTGQLGAGDDAGAHRAAPAMAAMPDGVGFTAVAAGDSHAIAIARDGTVWTWGGNDHGQLGRGTTGGTSTRPAPAATPAGVRFTAVSAGFHHSMALDTDGRIWTWGNTNLGRSGDGATPARVPTPAGTAFTAVSAGSHHSMALDTDGRIWSWGDDTDSVGHSGSLNTPAPVDTTQRFTAVSSGNDHAIAIARDGTVWTWGSNTHGQLGRTPDTANPANRPGQVPGPAGATRVNAGTGVSTAITPDTAWAWGLNDQGQLGIGTTDDTAAPARTPAPGGAAPGFRYTAAAPATGTPGHTLLLGNDGHTYACGSNTTGQLGDNTRNPATRPTTTWQATHLQPTDVLFGQSHNLATPHREPDGWHTTSPRHPIGTTTLTIRHSAHGTPQPDDTSQHFTYTGDTATITYHTDHGTPPPPQRVPKGDTAPRPDDPPTHDGWTFNGWFQGDTAYDFSQPVTHDLILTAKWAQWTTTPTQGPWQGGTNVRLDTPTSQVRFAQIATGRACSLAVGSDGNVYAWGYNFYSQLGDGTRVRRPAPIPVIMPEGVKITQVSANTYHVMALDRDGRIWTWGTDMSDQLGRTSSSATPAGRPGLVDTPEGVSFIAVSAGMLHSTALDRDGNIWTWGSNTNKQLGRDISGTTDATPKKIQLPKGTAFTAVSTGSSHSIGLSADGTAWSWGGANLPNNFSSDTLLGHAGGTDPAPVDTGLRFTAISASDWHSLAIAQDGTVQSWGMWVASQLGRTPTDTEPASRPGSVPGLVGATRISAGSSYSIAITGTDVWGWGRNYHGQLGTSTNNGVETNVETPERIPAPEETPAGFAYTSVVASAMGQYTLALGSNGEAYAFGVNHSGQLGDNTINRVTVGVAGANKPTMVWHPVGASITSVLFGTKPNMGAVERTAGGWLTVSPRHRPETVSLTVQYSTGVSSDPIRSEDIGLKFTFTGNIVTLSFVSDHGAHTPSQQVAAGEPTQRPADPSEEGWTFDGWFDGDVAYDFAAPLEHDLTVTGRWHRTGRWVLSPDHGSEHGDDTITLTAPAAPGFRLASVDTGGSSSLGIGSDGNLYTWGDNTNGQLGDGTTSQHTTPVKIPRPDGTDNGFFWVQATAGRTHSAAVGSDGNLYAWGDNTCGQLGDGTNTQRTTPVKVIRPAGNGFTWIRAEAGDGYTMAIGSDDNLYIWGSLPGGLGDTNCTTASTRPVKVALPQGVPSTFRFEKIAAGDRHATAIGSDDNLYTWGSNTHGQLGHADTGVPAAAATPIVAAGDDPKQPVGYVQASAAGDHTMAIDLRGRLWVWGDLADGTDTATPARIWPAGTNDTYRFTHTSTGRAHYTATGEDHRTWTWGDNTNGQLGHATSTPTQPTTIPGLNTTVTASMADTTIAIDTNGNTQAWGDNSNGQGGHGDTGETHTPCTSAIPSHPTPTDLTIDSTTLPLRRTGPNTWEATTMAHDPGAVPVRVRWTLAGQAQPDDTSNTYTYLHIFTLPNAGGTGIILLIIAGTLILAATTANRQRRIPKHH